MSNNKAFSFLEFNDLINKQFTNIYDEHKNIINTKNKLKFEPNQKISRIQENIRNKLIDDTNKEKEATKTIKKRFDKKRKRKTKKRY